MGGPHHLVVTPPVAVEDIASPPASSEGHPTVIGFLPSGEELAQLQERIGGRTVNPRSGRRIHTLTLTSVVDVAEVTKGPLF